MSVISPVTSERSAKPMAELHKAPPAGGLDISSAAFNADPYPVYARLRAEAPVYGVHLPTRDTLWLITRYDDVCAVLKDPRLLKDRFTVPSQRPGRQHWFRRLEQSKLMRPIKRNMLELDPPDHSRLRALVSKAFTPRMIEDMHDGIQALADELIDGAARRGGGGTIDVMRDYALPLPTIVIGNLLGVPAQDRRKFQRWTRAAMSVNSTWGLINAVPKLLAFARYIKRFIRRRRAQPRDDLMSALIRAEEAGDQLSDHELRAMVLVLLFAGFESTVHLIGNGVLTLLQHPDQLARLRADPGLIKPAVEELLRYASPAKITTDRYAAEDVTIAGVTIPRGEIVTAVVASANRDERQFPNPDLLDITREPNRHVTFGLGTHFCLGAALARLEGQIAIDTLLRRAPGLRLAVAPQDLHWRRGVFLRGLEALPVALG
jgi:cytochrome P450 PksS